jgi:hypothetical protein
MEQGRPSIKAQQGQSGREAGFATCLSRLFCFEYRCITCAQKNRITENIFVYPELVSLLILI